MWDRIEIWDINVLTIIETSNNNYTSNIIKHSLIAIVDCYLFFI